MISQLACAGRFEDIGKEGVFPGEGQDQIDMIVGNELVDRFHEVEEADKIEFRVIVLQFCFQFGPFYLVFVCYLYIVFVVHIDDVQAGIEEIEHLLNGVDGNSVIYILEISE